jgi:hypothetical protein
LKLATPKTQSVVGSREYKLVVGREKSPIVAADMSVRKVDRLPWDNSALYPTRHCFSSLRKSFQAHFYASSSTSELVATGPLYQISAFNAIAFIFVINTLLLTLMH